MNIQWILLSLIPISFLSIAAKGQLSIEKYSISVKPTMNFQASCFIEGVEINAMDNSYIYSIGYYNAEELVIPLGNLPREEYNQLNFLFGNYFDHKTIRYRIQGGLGILWGIKRSDKIDLKNSTLLTNYYFTKKFATIGIPIKFGGSYIPFNFMSIGIDLQININLTRPLFRPMFSITFGKLRD